MILTILLISFCNGTSFTHWCLLHLSNNWITCITSSLQKYVKIFSMTIFIFLFPIYANVWRSLKIFRVVKTQKAIRLSLTIPWGLLGWEIPKPSFVEVSVKDEELDTISVRCSITWSENLKLILNRYFYFEIMVKKILNKCKYYTSNILFDRL